MINIKYQENVSSIVTVAPSTTPTNTYLYYTYTVIETGAGSSCFIPCPARNRNLSAIKYALCLG